MLLVFVYEMILYINPCMLWVRNLSVMELGALFTKTGIILCCLKHCFANVCVVLCMCKSVLPRVL